MKLSVLHISDIHRGTENRLGNPILLDSLKRDRDHYTSQETPNIRPPDLIIVSGDLIQGVKDAVSDAETALRHQYDQALEFLNGLVDEFVGGCKRRIVVVPGNHDVSNYHFRQSLEPIYMDTGIKTKRKLVEKLFTPESPLRWSWPEFSLYKIARPEVYKLRFAAFVDFYNRFYDEHRAYSVEPEKQFDVFDFPDWDVTVVGFCSCHNNDLMNKQGAIHPDCIANAGEILRGNSNEGRLRFAVWHHNIEGSPLTVDYMDPDTVQNFIDSGFSLGFHGHQHKPQYLESRFRYASKSRITVISAGTLCGEAAYGYRLAHNIVEVDTEERTGCLHVREMQNINLQAPIWGPRSVAPGSDGSLKFQFDAPPEPFVKSHHPTSLLQKASEYYEECQYAEAARVLLPVAKSDELARPVLLDCLTHLGDIAGIVSVFDPPKSAAEAIVLMDALWNGGEQERLGEILMLPLISASTGRISPRDEGEIQGEVENMSEAIKKRITFDVETSRILQILSSEIYDSPKAFLRENVQNAYDAVLMRCEAQGLPIEDQSIDITVGGNSITVCDDGIGMTEDVLRNNFWRAGTSGKKSELAERSGVIGTFGIGAMANFGVCNYLRVESRHIDSNITLISSARRDDLKIAQECVDLEHLADGRPSGTSIIAELDSTYAVDESAASEYLKQYVRFLPVPVSVNDQIISQEVYEDTIFGHVEKFNQIASPPSLARCIRGDSTCVCR